jgi:hypothetical protein
MKIAAESIFLVFYVVCIWVGLPVAIFIGWGRWFRSNKSLSFLSLASVFAFGLATCSVLLAASSLVYAHAIGGFPFYDPRLMRVYRWGLLSSLAGVVLGLTGCWGRNTLRWYAPMCSSGAFVFWFVSAMGE